MNINEAFSRSKRTKTPEFSDKTIPLYDPFYSEFNECNAHRDYKRIERSIVGKIEGEIEAS